MIEASACGRPIVASGSSGGAGLLISGETGYLATLADVEDYARGIAGYLADSEGNQATGRMAVRRAKLFSWEHHVATVETAIRDVLGSRSAIVPITAAPEQEKAA